MNSRKGHTSVAPTGHVRERLCYAVRPIGGTSTTLDDAASSGFVVIADYRNGLFALQAVETWDCLVSMRDLEIGRSLTQGSFSELP